MVGRLFAIAVICLGAACGKSSPQSLAPVSNPTHREAELLIRVLPHPSQIAINRICVDPITFEPGRAPDFYYLNFGDGKQVYLEEPRVAELARRYRVATPLSPNRLLMPNASSRSQKNCDWQQRYYPPLFDADLAFMASMDRHVRGEVAGGHYSLWIFKDGVEGWDLVASSSGTYGRPII